MQIKSIKLSRQFYLRHHFHVVDSFGEVIGMFASAHCASETARILNQMGHRSLIVVDTLNTQTLDCPAVISLYDADMKYHTH